MSYENIPDELKRLINWCTWKYETVEGSPKPTKVPYNAKTGAKASSTDPQTWCAFNEATAANGYDGIGFFFGERDEYCGIDLDDAWAVNPDGSQVFENPQEIFERQQKIFAVMNSYSELSPSGKGLHVIVKASVPHGRRRDAVELYSSKRFFTMTGNVFKSAPIAYRQSEVEGLFEQMSPPASVYQPQMGDLVQREDDDEIYDRAASASNGELFIRLWSGDWSDYRSQSEADFALIDIIAFYTQHKIQIARMFRNSGLGQRKKAQRDDFVGHMINKSFDNQLPPVDLSAIQDQIEKALSASSILAEDRADNASKVYANASLGLAGENLTGFSPASFNLQSFDLKYHLKHQPPGLIGTIAQYIYASSPLPVPEISMVAALGLFAGIVGRQYNVSGEGLNLYIMLIANSGMGKDAIANGISRIMTGISQNNEAAKDFRGPADMGSGQGLIKHLANSKTKSTVSVMGEIGLRLKQITMDNASAPDRMLLRALLELYGRSGAGKTVEPTVYSDKANNSETIHSPAFSIIGESTPQKFYEALDESAAESGLLPRFIIVNIEPSRKRSDFNAAHNIPVPEQLIAALDNLAVHRGALRSNCADTPAKAGIV